MGIPYEEACEKGYDGPSPSEDLQLRNRIAKNARLDPRDPDFDETLVEDYDENDEEEE